MTDEEMAEEYYDSKFKSNESHFSKFDIEQAFLAGLKAGRPEWHDLRKDPNDLPKETGSYVVSRFANYLKRKKVSQTLFFIKGKGWQTKWIKLKLSLGVKSHSLRS